MNALLTISSRIIAYADMVGNANPSLKFVDWNRSSSAIPVDNPGSESLTLGPNSSTLIFDSSRATLIDGTTSFVLSSNPLDPARYRFTFNSGTDPVLRVGRNISTSGIALTMVANLNGTLTMTAGSGTPFTNVQVSDNVFIPGVTTGDADAGFDPTNEGLWTVLGCNDTVLTLIRDGDFVGVGEVVTPTTDAMLVYDPEGVQVNDKMDLSGGFLDSAFGTYDVIAVTDAWFEVISTTPLALETASPGATGMAFFLNAQRFIRVESNKACVVRFNGDTGNYNKLSPLITGGVGYCEKAGLVWSLVIVNHSILPATVTIITAE